MTVNIETDPMSIAPFFLLINPWITDFAAYDYWAKPLGLLLLASLLRAGGCGVAFIDCVDRYDAYTNRHPEVIPGAERKYGTGKYPKMLLQKPEAYAEIPRFYYRHGIHPDSLRQKLRAIDKPDLIWVTSIMTYWYPGIQQTISILREVFPDTPVWLGGIYAQLCPQHALRTSGASEIIAFPSERLPGKITATTGFSLSNEQEWTRFDLSPSPALDLLSKLTYAPVLTGQGCVFRCPYCASEILQPRRQRRGTEVIFEEISKWHLKYGVVDFAFYDDALLMQAQDSLEPAFRMICEKLPGLRFHTPNAVHICALTQECCRLIHEVGFSTLRLGLETTQSERQRDWGGKVKTEMFLAAVEYLFDAGFSSEQIGVYLLSGLPGQTPEEVDEAIHVVKKTGVLPYIAEYSPIPGTQMWSSALELSPFDLAGEPLYHNNTFFACRRPDFSYDDLLRLKELARQTRAAIN
jgi:radical SAM superfamily enzyme YgiQ (UPF0313 family)